MPGKLAAILQADLPSLVGAHTADVEYNKPVWYDRPRDGDGAALPAAAGINGRGIPASITVGSNGI